MRRKYLGVATLLALLAFVAVAIGDEVGPGSAGEFQSLTVTHKPTKPKKATTVKVAVDERTADGSQPVLTTESDVTLPKGMKLGYKDFPTCNPNKLVQPVDESKPPTGCTRKSMVGKGEGIADARSLLGADSAPIHAPVFAFNGTKVGGKPTYILWANSPIDPDITLVGKLVGSNHLNIPIPQGNPLCGGATGDPNNCAGIIHFDVTQGGFIKKKKHGKTVKVPYLTNPKKCPSGGYQWDIKFTYRNGDTLDPHSTVKC